MDTQFDIRFKELNINHYSVQEGQLQRLQAFIDEFSDKEDLEKHRNDLTYLKADALANDRQHEEAIETFNHLYQDKTYIFPTLIAQRIAEQLVLLKREDEALTIINQALKNEERVTDRLFLLFAAVSMLNDPDAKLQEHDQQIGEITAHMGITVPAGHETFSAKITFLRNESTKASRRYGELFLKHFKEPKKKRISVLEQYIIEEPIKPYRELAQEELDRLVSSA